MNAVFKRYKTFLAYTVCICVVNSSSEVEKSCSLYACFIKVIALAFDIGKSCLGKSACCRIEIVDSTLVLEPACLDISVRIGMVFLVFKINPSELLTEVVIIECMSAPAVKTFRNNSCEIIRVKVIDINSSWNSGISPLVQLPSARSITPC